MTARVVRLLRVSLTVLDLPRMEAFYRDTLGFARIGGGVLDPALLGAEGGIAETSVMRLGAQELELVAFNPPGAPYPPGGTACDPWFQHIAVVVRDMAAAFTQVQRAPITPISMDGPQLLPPGAGSVTAFKFRDPEGHPLELIRFPTGTGDPVWQHQADGLFLGFDHSAIVVGDVARSRHFYGGLGFAELSRSLNRGPEQERLDGLPADIVDVVALRTASGPTPHLELLGYHAPNNPGAAPEISVRDAASARLVFQAERLSAPLAHLRDPDGHRLLLIHDPAKTVSHGGH